MSVVIIQVPTRFGGLPHRVRAEPLREGSGLYVLLDSEYRRELEAGDIVRAEWGGEYLYFQGLVHRRRVERHITSLNRVEHVSGTLTGCPVCGQVVLVDRKDVKWIYPPGLYVMAFQCPSCGGGDDQLG